MKPPERFPPDDPREWLNRARSNLVRAKNRIPGAYLEDLCFDAQQAAEKAIKAVLIACDIEFPYVHDLDQLLTVLASTGQHVPDEIQRAGKLTPYAAAARYPGMEQPLSEQHYLEAMEIAESVVSWSKDRISSRLL